MDRSWLPPLDLGTQRIALSFAICGALQVSVAAPISPGGYARSSSVKAPDATARWPQILPPTGCKRHRLPLPNAAICPYKKSSKGNKPGKEGNRFWKNIALGFKTPGKQLKVQTSSL
ncbi:hypothetical protein ABZP36_000005 [Zizania latifolia]